MAAFSVTKKILGPSFNQQVKVKVKTKCKTKCSKQDTKHRFLANRPVTYRPLSLPACYYNGWSIKALPPFLRTVNFLCKFTCNPSRRLKSATLFVATNKSHPVTVCPLVTAKCRGTNSLLIELQLWSTSTEQPLINHFPLLIRPVSKTCL